MSNKTDPRKDGVQTPIAIIGMGCIFPTARNLIEFWRALRTGRDCITEVPETHWKASDYFDADPKKPDMTYCARGGFLPPVPFDPTEFGIPPTILEATDTTQLLGLVAAKAALDDAGYGESRDFDRDGVSVVVGVTGTQELVLPLSARLGHPLWRRALAEAGVAPDVAEDVVQRIADSYVGWQENSFPGLLGNVVAGRIANRLNLRGTNCAVDAACASSLSAIHLAMLELQSGRSEMALAGGADTLNDIFMYMCFSKTPALSPTGDARPFSADADGTVLGEGVGMILLKRLSDAERDGDRIYAVLRSMGTSSDGRSQSIYAPHAAGQARALRSAYRLAGVAPESIELIEAHGTGTKVGDATEFEALKTVFTESKREGAWCAIGSVKSQIGHTKAAAGVAGLIKAALAIHHRSLPPTIKVREPNVKMGIEESPFYVGAELRPWLTSAGRPRRAGVSAFGFGGSNFHAVLEEHGAALPAVAWDGSVQIIALSAETIDELRAHLREWIALVSSDRFNEDVLAYRAMQSRESFSSGDAFRLALVIEAGEDVAARLLEAEARLARNSYEESWTISRCYFGAGNPEGKLAFVFPGQGSQYPRMARDLACTFPEMISTVSEAEGVSGQPLGELIYPRPAFEASRRSREAESLIPTDVAQPALAAVSLGITRVLERFGVKPAMTAGHSFGELVALCAAGRYDAHILHRLARLRGRLMAEGHGDRGAMLAVKAAAEDVAELVESAGLDVVVANRNSPTQCVLSGERAAVAKAAELCKQRGLAATPLRVSGAFHSRLMEDALQPFRNALEATEFAASNIEVYANSTGMAYPSTSAESRRLLGDQLVRPVDFVTEIQTMHDAGARVFVEVGPRTVVSGLIADILKGRLHVMMAVDASAGRGSGVLDLAAVLARLAALGFEVDLTRWERPVSDPRVPKMTVSLSGANYRAARKERPPKVLAKTPTAVESKAIEARRAISAPLDEHSLVSATIPPPPPRDDPYEISNAGLEKAMAGSHVVDCPEYRAARDEPGLKVKKSMSPPDGSQSNHAVEDFVVSAPALQEAVRLVPQGLAAMQRLQQQTAQAHQKFLEGQTEAHKTFQVILEGHQRLIEAAATGRPGDPVIAAPPPSLTTRREELPSATPAIIPSAREGSSSIPERGTLDPAHEIVTSARHADVGIDRRTAEQALIAVVCEKTGYPAEMIDLSMDIEADLGVDSIKRVEIIAGLEERLPGFAGVKPEYMGSIRTLSQIIDFVAASAGTSTKGPPTPVSAPHGGGRTETHPARSGASEIVVGSSGRVVSGARGSAPPSAIVNRTTFGETLLSVVADSTGYPRDMLELSMDMEADLGIDSIKRVEILAGVEARIPGLPPVQPEYMGSLRTLAQIVDYCIGTVAPAGTRGTSDQSNDMSESKPASGQKSDTRDTSSPTAVLHDSPRAAAERRAASMNRRVLTPVDLPQASGEPLRISVDREILVTDDGAELSRQIVSRLDAAGYRARLLPITSIDAAARVNVGGLIIVAPTRPSNGSLWGHETENFIKSGFALMKSTAARLSAAAAQGGALFATISRMDGAFGLAGGTFDAAQGGLAGLAKSAAREWTNVSCRALDVALTWSDAAAAAAAVVRELGERSPVEVGLNEGIRCGLALSAAHGSSGGGAPFNPGDLVIVTGGARGVTAEAALALAKRYRPTLVLLGRTPLPEGEPGWLSGVESDDDVRKAVRANEFAGRKPTPKELKASVARHLARREIRRNLERITAAGSIVRYESVDVCDAAAVREVISHDIARFGPVRGLVHGAGVIEDRKIENKTPEQFAAVFDTKVTGLRHVLDALDMSELRAIAMFSSVSARCGNQGQTDYAAANEVLNKAAQRLAKLLPNARVVSLNWGPWDGGMVHPALRQAFVEHGLRLIPIEDGAELVADELSGGGDGVEIVVGADFDSMNPSPVTETPIADSGITSRSDLTLAFERVLDPNSHPFLLSHIIDGRPVLPAAVMMEWLAHAAMHAHPGLHLQGLSDFRVLKGVVVGDQPPGLRFYCGKVSRSGDVFNVDVELRSAPHGVGRAPERLHARATVVLCSRLASAPPFEAPPALIDRAYDRGAAGAYAEVLFHGDLFKGIERVEGFSSGGMIVRVRPAANPSDWMADPLRSHWLTEPLVIDAVFQTAILWAVEEMGAPCLPAAVGRYRQYRSSFPPEPVSLVYEVRAQARGRCVADVTILARDGTVIAQLDGVDCTVDAELQRAFTRRVRSDAAAAGAAR
ncbi:MAG TPA: SDR family NAD(P)-dependent oxidoreductase [Phycisphaerae bacterium]|nr:SDR family NAD(P)-dependent oxidoreductase [Phycisphaerae bacterium]